MLTVLGFLFLSRHYKKFRLNIKIDNPVKSDFDRLTPEFFIMVEIVKILKIAIDEEVKKKYYELAAQKKYDGPNPFAE